MGRSVPAMSQVSHYEFGGKRGTSDRNTAMQKAEKTKKLL